MSAQCPRCGKALQQAQVDEYTVRVCTAWKGVLVAHPDLVTILAASWRVVTEKFAEEAEFRAPEGWQSEPVRRCPDCGKAMEKYGYMGMAAIQIDSCDRCSLVWLDADELQNMVVALAKSNYRGEGAFRDTQEHRLEIGATTTGDAKREAKKPVNFVDGQSFVAAQVLMRFLTR